MSIPPALRWQVWQEDNFTCRECGSRAFLEIDHIVPRALGGGDEGENLQTLCRPCNSRKRAKPPPGYVVPGLTGIRCCRCDWKHVVGLAGWCDLTLTFTARTIDPETVSDEERVLGIPAEVVTEPGTYCPACLSQVDTDLRSVLRLSPLYDAELPTVPVRF